MFELYYLLFFAYHSKVFFAPINNAYVVFSFLVLLIYYVFSY